jgi:hypothetical protein
LTALPICSAVRLALPVTVASRICVEAEPRRRALKAGGTVRQASPHCNAAKPKVQFENEQSAAAKRIRH